MLVHPSTLNWQMCISRARPTSSARVHDLTKEERERKREREKEREIEKERERESEGEGKCISMLSICRGNNLSDEQASEKVVVHRCHPTAPIATSGSAAQPGPRFLHMPLIFHNFPG